MSKDNSKLSPKSIAIISALFIALIIVIVIIVVYSVDSSKYLGAVEYTSSEIAEKSRTTTGEYEYALLVLDQEAYSAGESIGIEEYVLSSERDGTKRTYTYLNTDGSILSEWWDAGNEEGKYDVYIYSDEFETWVNTEMTEEPIPNDIWRMFDIMSQYTVLPETGEWYDTGDECYVLQLIGNSDGYYAIYEEIYIRCADFMPMGIIEYCVDTEDNDRVDELNPDDFNIDGSDYTVTDAEITSSEYNELIRKYSILFSHEDQQLFDKPKTYISDEDYMYLIYTYGEEEEESDGETEE